MAIFPPEPGDTAIRQDAAKKASQVCKSMNESPTQKGKAS